MIDLFVIDLFSLFSLLFSFSRPGLPRGAQGLRSGGRRVALRGGPHRPGGVPLQRLASKGLRKSTQNTSKQFKKSLKTA